MCWLFLKICPWHSFWHFIWQSVLHSFNQYSNILSDIFFAIVFGSGAHRACELATSGRSTWESQVMRYHEMSWFIDGLWWIDISLLFQFPYVPIFHGGIWRNFPHRAEVQRLSAGSTWNFCDGSRHHRAHRFRGAADPPRSQTPCPGPGAPSPELQGVPWRWWDLPELVGWRCSWAGGESSLKYIPKYIYICIYINYYK